MNEAAIKSILFLTANLMSYLSFSDTAGRSIFAPGIRTPLRSHKVALFKTLTFMDSPLTSVHTTSNKPSSIKSLVLGVTVLASDK